MKTERENETFLEEERRLIMDILEIAALEDVEETTENIILRIALLAKENIAPTPSNQNTFSPRELREQKVSVTDLINGLMEQHSLEKIQLSFIEATAYTLSEFDALLSPILDDEQRIQIIEKTQLYLAKHNHE